MVSPHDSWDDVEDGYRRGAVGVVVAQTPAAVTDRPAAASGANDADGTVFAVSLRRPIGSPHETETELAAFEDGRTAWEYANLVTHYVAESADAIFAESQLRGRERPPTDRWQPTEPIAGRDAAAVLRKQVGHHADKVEHLLERRPAPAE